MCRGFIWSKSPKLDTFVRTGRLSFLPHKMSLLSVRALLERLHFLPDNLSPTGEKGSRPHRGKNVLARLFYCSLFFWIRALSPSFIKSIISLVYHLLFELRCLQRTGLLENRSMRNGFHLLGSWNSG